MRVGSARFSRCLFVVRAIAPLSVIACTESTTPPPVPTQLSFSVQPQSPLAGRLMLPVVVTVQDASGNTVTSANNRVSLTAVGGTGTISVSGTFGADAVNGIATFPNLTINTPGSFTLRATSPDLTEAISIQFVVDIGPPSKLAFSVQPTTTDQGVAIAPAIQVIAQDPVGNTVTAGTSNVTLSIGTNPGTGTLSGTTTVATINGVATFSNISINNLGVGYTLVATAPTLTGATSNTFSIIVPLTFTMVTAGYFHSCGVHTDGSTYCWSGVPTPVSFASAFSNASAGRDHTCGITAAGSAYCWGANENGRLGTGNISSSTAPIAVSGGHVFGSASAGYSHSCGVTTAGFGYCWGDNSAGHLGDGTQTQRLSPAPVSGGLAFSSISPGRFFSCGVTPAGVAYCWGDNSSATLGDGTRTSRTTPTVVSGGLVFATVGAGGFHSCGLTTGGAAHCWGWNIIGQLGNGNATDSMVPVPVSGGHVFASISVGNRHTCGVTNAGIAYCWGDNSNGELGDGTATTFRSTPTAVSGGLVFASLSAGRFHSCGVTTGSEAYCWGANGSGQLGTGDFASTRAPVRVR